MPNSRVLIVDDYELWRQYVAATLRGNRRFQPIGEAADAGEAVQLVRRLRPDLILLDIGLPGEDGIQAARRILAEDPGVKILFVSEHQSPELVDAALATGAWGYVVKSSAGRELLPAMSSVIEGGRFLSTCLKRAGRSPCQHAAGFYTDNVSLLNDYGAFAEPVLKSGAALVVVSVASRRGELEHTLSERGIDVSRMTAAGRLRWLDVADALASVMVDDWPDDARFSKVMTELIVDAAGQSRARVGVWGECAPALWREGKADAAIRIEQLWDELSSQHQIETLCGYSMADLPRDDDNGVFQRIRRIHSVVR